MNTKKIRKSVDAILLKMNRMELHVSDYEWLNRQLTFISRQLDSEKSSVIDGIIERSQPELNMKMDRLMKAMIEVHPTLAMDNSKHEELYLSLHSLKESVTSL